MEKFGQKNIKLDEIVDSGWMKNDILVKIFVMTL